MTAHSKPHDQLLDVISSHTGTAKNGVRRQGPFSDGEMRRRQNDLRQWLAANRVDAALFTSYHAICYYSSFLYTQFGRKYGFIVDGQNATLVASSIDAGQPWRRAFADEVLLYTDWRRDNYYRAVRQALKSAKRVGIEFDQVSLDFRRLLGEEFPHIEFVDVAQAAMWMRTIKSAEEHAHIRLGADTCRVGAKALIAAIGENVPEYEIALASTNAMVREIARLFPSYAELMDSWTWFQSGVETDGAHNPVTNRRLKKGDILSLNCFPMIFGYYTALERTLFFDHASDAHLDYWQKNCEVMRQGSALIGPGKKCSDIAKQLNELYREWGLLRYRSFGYGHSFGVLSHYYGREAGVELREDVETVLKPGMVVSMEPMITIPEGAPGAGGYREHDIFIVTATGAENISQFPYGPDHLIVRA
ncbi:MAG: aminopeptidase P family protein [Candidatus Symbiobacter sp.]|nr:aminopeptidase P family protein [Candidatus Symbiobacter sp.]